MAKSRDDMVTSAKRLAGMENSTFVPDVDWAEWIERGVEDLWEQLTQAFGVDFFMKPGTITLVSGQEDYSLPDDFYQLINIYYTHGGKNINCEKFQWAEEAGLRNVTLLEKRVFYRLIGMDSMSGVRKIKILPVPDNTNVITYRYCFKPSFPNGNATIDAINGWEEYAELVAAIKALNKEESDPSGLIMDLNRVASRIEKNKTSVDAARPAKISDTRRDRWRRFRGRYVDDIV